MMCLSSVAFLPIDSIAATIFSSLFGTPVSISVSSPGLAPGEVDGSRRNAFTGPRAICQSPSTICVCATSRHNEDADALTMSGGEGTERPHLIEVEADAVHLHLAFSAQLGDPREAGEDVRRIPQVVRLETLGEGMPLLVVERLDPREVHVIWFVAAIVDVLDRSGQVHGVALHLASLREGAIGRDGEGDDCHAHAHPSKLIRFDLNS